MFQNEYEDQLWKYGDVFDDNANFLLAAADIVLAVGGDGTIIHAAKLAAEAGKPVLGINAGYLGYTAGLELEEVEKLAELTDGSFPTEKRMMFDVSVNSASGERRLFCHSLNDAVISRGTLSRIIGLSVSENGRSALYYRADGLIVSTPSGSTAYALSAGGPAISPTLSCITVTPICSHDLTSRTIIFNDTSEICVTAENCRGNIVSDAADSEVYLTVDGEISCRLNEGDTVTVKKSEISAYFITLKQLGFSEILRLKFHC